MKYINSMEDNDKISKMYSKEKVNKQQKFNINE